jgi:hypothetical protein
MAVTYKLIETVTVGSGGAASIEFTSIPQTFTDLLVVYSTRSDRAVGSATTIAIKLNGSTSSFTARVLEGSGSSASSGTGTNDIAIISQATSTASVFGSGQTYIPNYAGSTNKSFSSDSVQETNGATSFQQLWAGLWSDTSAITSISILPPSTINFVQYSSASLYGIKNS